MEELGDFGETRGNSVGAEKLVAREQIGFERDHGSVGRFAGFYSGGRVLNNDRLVRQEILFIHRFEEDIGSRFLACDFITVGLGIEKSGGFGKLEHALYYFGHAGGGQDCFDFPAFQRAEQIDCSRPQIDLVQVLQIKLLGLGSEFLGIAGDLKVGDHAFPVFFHPDPWGVVELLAGDVEPFEDRAEGPVVDPLIVEESSVEVENNRFHSTLF